MSLIGQKVFVLGAGIGGLAVARALALRGAAVTVLEQADSIQEVGAGIQISPNGAAVLRALGLEDALLAQASRALAVDLCDGLTGNLVTRLDVGRLRPNEGYHFLHRADLIQILLKGARDAGVELRLLQRIENVDLTGAEPRYRTALGACGQAGLLIGADGLHSRVRHAILGAETPHFTGQVAWRALIPELPEKAHPVAEIHMGPGRHLVSYPLRGGHLRNVVAVEERPIWVEEGWSHKSDPSEMQAAFAQFSPRVRGWLDQVDEVGLWGLFRHPVAPRWYQTTARGGAALLGDAAHPTLPFLAQGACMALEDAWVLAQCLAQAEIPAALARYESLRKARCTRIVAAADGNARLYHLSGLLRQLGHLGLRLGGQVAPDLALGRFDWLYSHDVTRAM